MNYDTNEWTFGTELEFADVYRFNPLPEGAKWNKLDNSIVNSNGIANDPSGRVYQYGGEINTKPTRTIEEQLNHIESVINILNPKPIINYKCNLHFHIRVPGLDQDLDTCKHLLKFNHKYMEQIRTLIDPLEIPNKEMYPEHDEYIGAKKRLLRNKHSHHYLLPPKRYEKVLNSNSIEEFFESHFAHKGKLRLVFMSPREGINIRQLWDGEVDTIEFRHFFGTLDMLEYKSGLTWCYEYLNSALNTGEEPKSILERNKWMKFPKQKRFNLKLNNGFELTNFCKNKICNIKFHTEKILKGDI